MIPSARCDFTVLAAFAALSVTPMEARADPASPATPPDGPALFKRARALLEAGDLAQACPLFHESFAATPSVGALLNIARCHEREGALATAFEDYRRALQLSRETRDEARRAAIGEAARRAMEALEPRLPRLRISVPSPPAGLVLTRDGVAVEDTSLDQGIPLDPGLHQVTASAPGHRALTRSILLEEGKTTPVIIALVPEPVVAEPRQALDRPALTPAPAPRKTVPTPPPARTQLPAWAWVAGGAGVALAGAGAFFLADDLAAIRALRENCPSDAGGSRCKASYDYQADNARKNRDLPLALGLGGAGIAGIAAAATGVVLGVSTRHRQGSAIITATAWPSPGGLGAALQARF